MLDKASKSVWELMSENDAFGKEIGETVERIFYRLSGQEPLPVRLPNGEVKAREQPDKENETEISDSLLKKRSFNEMCIEGSGAMGMVADGSSDPALAPAAMAEDFTTSMTSSNVKS